MYPRHTHSRRSNRRNRSWTVYLLSVLMVLGFVAALPGAATAEDASASLVVNVYTCESRNDPIDPTESLVAQCTLGTSDIVFTLDSIPANGGGASASTGTGGAPSTISFTDLPSGDYQLVQQTPDTIGLSYILECTSTVRTFDYPFSPFAIIEPGGRLNIALLPGEQLSCDWYNVQAPEQPSATTLTVRVFNCSGDVIDPALCEPAPNVDLRLSNASAEVVITSDANGVASFDGTGTFQIEPISELDDRVFCGFQNDSGDAVDQLALDPANPVAIDAYYCYPGA